MALQQEQVMAALRTVQDPELFKDIVTLGMVKDVRVGDGDAVFVHVELTTPACPMGDKIKADVEAAVRRAGARGVEVKLSANTRGAAAGGAKRDVLPQVKNVVAAGAGKGGVGKSTIAVNLAVGLHRRGAAVGLMDGDIYGPSVPTLLGIKGRAPEMVANKKVIPFHAHGIHAMTIGSLVPDERP